jgi:uncharacterized RDD family membrane protein YckC
VDSPSPATLQDLLVDGGMLVGGQPAALIITTTVPGWTMGHFYRFDGTQWSPFATQSFPLGSAHFHVFSCQDGQKSYLAATTSMGAGYHYAIESTGIRKTGMDVMPQFNRNTVTNLLAVPFGMLQFGAILGGGIWFLMWQYTKPDYAFGNQSVKLASVARRGLARLIDLIVIVGSTWGVAWILMHDLDSLALFEALNLKIDHPTIQVVSEATVILGLWLAFAVVSLVIMQGCWGLTPGKWCCGLRTLRSTLRPSGIARSLARELVMWVDAGNFLCWTPGVLSIALTDYRQRLGDLVADTVVVESRSLSRGIQ